MCHSLAHWTLKGNWFARFEAYHSYLNRHFLTKNVYLEIWGGFIVNCLREFNILTSLDIDLGGRGERRAKSVFFHID